MKPLSTAAQVESAPDDTLLSQPVFRSPVSVGQQSARVLHSPPPSEAPVSDAPVSGLGPVSALHSVAHLLDSQALSFSVHEMHVASGKPLHPAFAHEMHAPLDEKHALISLAHLLVTHVPQASGPVEPPPPEPPEPHLANASAPLGAPLFELSLPHPTSAEERTNERERG